MTTPAERLAEIQMEQERTLAETAVATSLYTALQCSTAYPFPFTLARHDRPSSQFEVDMFDRTFTVTVTERQPEIRRCD